MWEQPSSDSDLYHFNLQSRPGFRQMVKFDKWLTIPSASDGSNVMPNKALAEALQKEPNNYIPQPVFDALRAIRINMPAITKARKPRERLRWKIEANFFYVFLLYIDLPICPTLNIYWQILHKPTDQGIEDQRRVIVKNHLLSLFCCSFGWNSFLSCDGKDISFLMGLLERDCWKKQPTETHWMRTTTTPITFITTILLKELQPKNQNYPYLKPTKTPKFDSILLSCCCPIKLKPACLGSK